MTGVGPPLIHATFEIPNLGATTPSCEIEWVGGYIFFKNWCETDSFIEIQYIPLDHVYL